MASPVPFVMLIAFIANVQCQQGPYVFDLLKPALTAAEVETILSSQDANSYPHYDIAQIPQTSFRCSDKAQPGFYADVDTQCQVFHRCDLNGNQTSYFCVNTTVFNQITLVCDYWYNVDCASSLQHENFANSRLYSDRPLFDTPPADYVIQSVAQNFAQSSVGQSRGRIQVTSNQRARQQSGNQQGSSQAQQGTHAVSQEAPSTVNGGSQSGQTAQGTSGQGSTQTAGSNASPSERSNTTRVYQQGLFTQQEI